MKKISISRYQKRFWIEWKLDPKSLVYNFYFVIKIKGDLNTHALNASLNDVINKYFELGRAYFIAENENLYQIIADRVPVSIVFKNISNHRREKQQKEEKSFINRVASHIFDLSSPPLFYFGLLKKTEDEYILILNFHHIILDGNSVSHLFDLISTLYNHYAYKIKLPNMRFLKLDDYINHEIKNNSSSFLLNRARDYFNNLLKDQTLYTNLPFKRKHILDVCSNTPVFFELNKKETYLLKRYVEKRNTTVFNLMAAVYAALLMRYSGKSTFLINYPTNVRPKTFSNIIGCFINVIPISINLNHKNLTFCNFLQHITSQRNKSKKYQFYPYEDIVSNIKKIKKSIDQNENINISIGESNFSRLNLKLKNLNTSVNKYNQYEINNEIQLVYETRTTINFKLDYKSELFDKKIMGSFSSHFINLLNECIKDDKQLINSISFLNKQEYKKLLIDCNKTEVPYSRDKTVHQLFGDQAKKTPKNVALVFEDKKITYEELNERSNQLAHYIRDQYKKNLNKELRPNTLVAICLERSLEIIIGILGILKSGGAYVPLDPEYPEQRLQFMLNDTNCAIVLTQESILNKYPFLTNDKRKSILLDANWNHVEQCPSKKPRNINKSTNLMYIIYTSGSTGKPKGVMVQHKSVINLINFEIKKLNIKQESKALMLSSYGFDASIWECYPVLLAGGALTIISEKDILSVQSFMRILRKNKISILTITPVFLSTLPKIKLKDLKTLIVAGDVCEKETVDFWAKNRTFINAYGPTEGTVCSTLCTYKNNVSPNDIGKNINNVVSYVFDNNMQIVPAGIPGELYIGGDNLARGYLNRPKLTKEKFVENPFLTNEEKKRKKEKGEETRLYKTGDLVKRLPDGNLEFLGRIDNQVKIRGYRIELEEIASLLNQYKDIEKSIIILRKDENQKLIAYYKVSKLLKETKQQQDVDDYMLNWKKLYDAEYNKDNKEVNTFDISGWDSSYTEKPISETEMKEWINNTLDRIQKLKPKNILEIGCGTGLLLYPLSLKCSKYIGIDFSPIIIKTLKNNIKSLLLENIELYIARADKISEIDCIKNKKHEIDTIILNSVIQYFPNIKYLENVLTKSINIMGSGKIFIGDVRDYRLLNEFHYSVLLYRQTLSEISTDIKQINSLISDRIKLDKELLVSPEFFVYLQKKIPYIKHIELLPKYGVYDNEMNNFRYDVILHINRNISKKVKKNCNVNFINWNKTKNLENLLKSNKQIIAIRNYPNKRIYSVSKNHTRDIFTKVHSIQELRHLAKEYQYHLYIYLSLKGEMAKTNYNLLFYKAKNIKSLEEIKYNILCSAYKNIRTPAKLANNPLKHLTMTINDSINHNELREYLSKMLPTYMIPSQFVEVNDFPITPNGKIDKNKLYKSYEHKTISKNISQHAETKIEKILVKIWQDSMFLNKIDVNDNFFSLGGNSITMIQISSMAKKHGIDIEPATIMTYPTIRSLANNLLTKHKKTPGVSDNNCINSMDLQLAIKDINDFDISLKNIKQYPKPIKYNNILLTGVTGLLGSQLLCDLLELTKANIYCLIREKNGNNIKDRFLYTLKNYNFDSNLINNKRVVLIKGDLNKDSFGMSSNIYKKLVMDIDAIYHCAANINLNFNYKHLKNTNVNGTVSAINIITEGKPKDFHYISTIATTRNLSITSKPSHKTIPYLLNGYTITKWVSENLLWKVHKKGMGVTIYRPGSIIGNTKTGIISVENMNAYLLLLKGCVQMRVAPNWDYGLEITPVDVISRSIVSLSLQSDRSGKVYNLNNPNILSFRDFIQILNDNSFKIEIIDFSEWINKYLANIKEDNALFPLKEFYRSKQINLLKKDNIIYSQTHKFLKKLGIVYPKDYKKMLSMYISSLKKINFL